MLLLVGSYSHFMKREKKNQLFLFLLFFFFSKEIEHNGHTHFARSQSLENELNDLCNVFIQVPWFCPSFMENSGAITLSISVLYYGMFYSRRQIHSPQAQVHSAGREHDKMFHTGGKRQHTEPVCSCHKGNVGTVPLPKSFREQKEVQRHVLYKICFLHLCVGKCNVVEIAVFIS